MTVPRDLFPRVDQMILWQLGEDWPDEFDGVYEAAEAWVRDEPDEVLSSFVREIDALIAAVPDPLARLRLFMTDYAFAQDDGQGFDTWLRAVRQRAAEAVAGIHNHPLVDPPR